MSVTVVETSLTIKVRMPEHHCDGCGRVAPTIDEVDRIQRGEDGAFEVVDFRTEGWNGLALPGYPTQHLCGPCSAAAILVQRQAASGRAEAEKRVPIDVQATSPEAVMPADDAVTPAAAPDATPDAAPPPV